MNLVQRARKAVKLDIESFASLLGIPWKDVERWELGKATPSTLVMTLLRVVEAHPEPTREVLERVRQQRLNLYRRIEQAVLQLGRGPKHAAALEELRPAVMYHMGQMGKERVPGAEAEEVTQALLHLERLRRIVLEPAADRSKLSRAAQEAAIFDRARGHLVFALPGPALQR